MMNKIRLSLFFSALLFLVAPLSFGQLSVGNLKLLDVPENSYASGQRILMIPQSPVGTTGEPLGSLNVSDLRDWWTIPAASAADFGGFDLLNAGKLFASGFQLTAPPAEDDGLTKILVRDPVTGDIKVKNASSLGAQDLSLAGNTLSLTGDGTPVDLSGYLDNTDAQDLSLSSNILSLTGDGTPVDLSGYLDNTDTQDLNLAGNTLSLTGDGTPVDLSGYLDNTDAQDLDLAGNTLSLSGDGTPVDLSGYLDAPSWANHQASGPVELGGEDIIEAGNVDLENLTLVNVPFLDNSLTDILVRDTVSGQMSRRDASTLDAQDLSLASNTLSLTGDASPVDLTPFMDANTWFAFPASGTVDINGENLDNVDTATISSLILSQTPPTDNAETKLLARETGGALNLVDASTLDDQDLSLASNTLSLTGDASSVDLTPFKDADLWSTFPATQAVDFNGQNLTSGGTGTFSTLNLSLSPAEDNSETKLLVRDSSGAVELRDVSTLPGGGGGGAPSFVVDSKTSVFDPASPPSSPSGATAGAALGSVAVEDFANYVAYFEHDGATWALESSVAKPDINFRDMGGLEGTGLNDTQRQSNWSLLKTAEGVADTDAKPIFLPEGTWDFLPTYPIVADINDPWLNDHIEFDDGVTVIRGAGMDATTLLLPSQGYYYFIRQRTWDGTLVLEDLTLDYKGSALHTATFTVDPVTDRMSIASHGFPGDSTYLKFTSTDTLPAPLGDDTQNSKDRVAVEPFDLNTFYVKDWLTPLRVFTASAVDAGTDTITINSHGYTNGDLVVLRTDSADPPAGLTAGTRYYVISASTNTFQVSATSGGAAVGLADGGSGTHGLAEVIDLTDAGTGTHTAYEIGERAWVSAGYHIGATNGTGLDTGIDTVQITFNRVRFRFMQPFSGVSSNSAKDVTFRDCEIVSNTGVSVTAFQDEGLGTEGVDFTRSRLVMRGNRFTGGYTTGETPFGNHFVYAHSGVNTTIIGNHFEGCWNNAVQFQSTANNAGPGEQNVTANFFRDNELHFISAQSAGDRSRVIVANNRFAGFGSVQFRSDGNFTGNFYEVNATPALSLVDDGTDDTLRQFPLKISGNTFLIKGVTSPNAVFAMNRDGEHTVTFESNTISRDPSLSAGTQIFLGTLGSIAGDAPKFFFRNNTYDFETTGNAIGWFLYPGDYVVDGEFADGPEALFLTTATGGSDSSLNIKNCEFQAEDGSDFSQRSFISIGHTGWTVTGRNNLLADGSYIDNDSGDDHRITFGAGRNDTTIASAATVYVDPSYDEHEVTGTTTIDTINIGTTGNVQANAAGVNHEDAWTGTVRLIVPSGLTLSNSGNIANGPITTTSADVITLLRQADDTWLIAK